MSALSLRVKQSIVATPSAFVAAGVATECALSGSVYLVTNLQIIDVVAITAATAEVIIIPMIKNGWGYYWSQIFLRNKKIYEYFLQIQTQWAQM